MTDDDDVWVRVTQHRNEYRPEADRVPIGTVGRLIMGLLGYNHVETWRGRMWEVYFPGAGRDFFFDDELEAAEKPEQAKKVRAKRRKSGNG